MPAQAARRAPKLCMSAELQGHPPGPARRLQQRAGPCSLVSLQLRLPRSQVRLPCSQPRVRGAAAAGRHAAWPAP
ncbi:MAG: hypothetical protein WDW36_008957 [Sanguina aurantia]